MQEECKQIEKSIFLLVQISEPTLGDDYRHLRAIQVNVYL